MTTMDTLHHTIRTKLSLSLPQCKSSPSFIPSLVEWRKEKQNENDKNCLRNGVSTFDCVMCIIPLAFFAFRFLHLFSGSLCMFSILPSLGFSVVLSPFFCSHFLACFRLVCCFSIQDRFAIYIAPHHVSFALNWLFLRPCSHVFVRYMYVRYMRI